MIIIKGLLKKAKHSMLFEIIETFERELIRL